MKKRTVTQLAMEIRQAVKSVSQICCLLVSVTHCRHFNSFFFEERKKKKWIETKRQQILAIRTTNYYFDTLFMTITRIKREINTTSDWDKNTQKAVNSCEQRTRATNFIRMFIGSRDKNCNATHVFLIYTIIRSNGINKHKHNLWAKMGDRIAIFRQKWKR